MDSGIVVALIAAFGGLLTSMYTLQRQGIQAAKFEHLKHALDEESQEKQRKLDAIEYLDRFREPLLHAAADLKFRINNIRQRGFLVLYVRSDDESRRRVALLGTLYRFGRYWAVGESLYTLVDVVRFERDEDTKAVSDLLILIASEFAPDSPDNGRLMVWRDEQHAIGELMMREGGIGSIGFAKFTASYEAELSTWFSSMERDLQSDRIEESARLRHLENLLGQLVEQLNKGRREAL